MSGVVLIGCSADGESHFSNSGVPTCKKGRTEEDTKLKSKVSESANQKNSLHSNYMAYSVLGIFWGPDPPITH